MRWDSPRTLATAATLAIHLIAITVGDAIVVTRAIPPPVPAPRIELVEVEVPAVLKPPPPPPPAPAAEPPPPPPIAEAKPPPRPQVARAQPPPTAAPEPPPPPTSAPEPAATSGGDDVVHMEGVAPSATGVAVAPGKSASARVGRGGSGGGTGAGSGSGSGDEPPRPISVATIKSPAMPKGDFGYIDASKDYPAEARALGIEGAIRVRLVVDEHGKVKSRVLLSRLGHGLDELAMKRAAEIEFEPAKDTDDRAVASVVVWTFNMTMPK